MKVNHLFNIVY